MQIYNTEQGRKEEFIPAREGKISIYVCGITTYDYAHIGHARSAVAFDVLFRYFLYKGFDVCFIRNFTDIDDKIIARANENGVAWHIISEQFIRAYHEDMDRLGVLRPKFEPKASEHIDDMIACIEALITKGFAYITPHGDVYYRVRKCANYGLLSGHSIDSLYNNVRITSSSDKEDLLDFALWKRAKAGEPFWKSPWSDGRPGWHIECTAMSTRYAELPIDIHGGGRDLIFPHHENEKAQTESICDCPFVRYWVHNGFVQINAEKMSKSLNNFTTVRDIYKEYLPEVLRYFLLTKHYRTPIDFSLDAMRDAEKNLRTMYTAYLLAQQHIAMYGEAMSFEEKTAEYEEYCFAKRNFFDCLDDDCNTACALGYLFGMIHCVYKVFHEKQDRGNHIVYEFLKDIGIVSHILGILTQEPQEFLQQLRRCIAERNGINEENIAQRIEERTHARNIKDFTRADAIRDELASQGIVLQDTKDGTEWDFV